MYPVCAELGHFVATLLDWHLFCSDVFFCKALYKHMHGNMSASVSDHCARLVRQVVRRQGKQFYKTQQREWGTDIRHGGHVYLFCMQ